MVVLDKINAISDERYLYRCNYKNRNTVLTNGKIGE